MSLIVSFVSALLVINFSACGVLSHKKGVQTLGVNLSQLCHKGKLCQYGEEYKQKAQCGVLVANFRLNRNKKGKERLSKFHSDLRELVKKQGAIVQKEDADLGRMILCYKDSSAKAMSLNKKQLEKHPAVYFVTYNHLVQHDSTDAIKHD